MCAGSDQLEISFNIFPGRACPFNIFLEQRNFNGNSSAPSRAPNLETLQHHPERPLLMSMFLTLAALPLLARFRRPALAEVGPMTIA